MVKSLANTLIVTSSTDPFARGLDYLYGVRSLAPEPDMVDVMHNSVHRAPICQWIGQYIEQVNAALQVSLQACHRCISPSDRPLVKVLATPLAQSFQLDGLCNLQTTPITILIDVGRLAPEDWWLLVAHEYAHAYARCPGHHQVFTDALTRLCLGLGVVPPSGAASPETDLPFYPPYEALPDSLAFWRGEERDWQVRMTYYYGLSSFMDCC